MDLYPEDYVAHNLPLILLSGLRHENDEETAGSGKTRSFLHEGGFRLNIDAPVLHGKQVEILLDALLDHDASNIPWNGSSLASRDGKVFRIKCVGRKHSLPPRKAPPPPQSPRFTTDSRNASPPGPLVLHSTLSPLTPSSPLYPDGIITPHWITKHQSRLPSAFITFFRLTTDATTSVLQDNKLKSEVNNIRNVLASTNYKVRFVVVLLGDGDIDPSEVSDRLGMIRRTTGLDTKTLSFLSFDASETEISDFARLLLLSIHPSCIDYYRDLSKHARRKRNRNGSPQPTIPPNTTRELPSQGWIVRYEFKLGVFAEFRQELDAACRNYEAAYENLFSAELFETIPSWSPRFNEARMIADVIALRIIRCLLWSKQSTAAVRSWLSHRDRIQDLLDRRSRGTGGYGWQAWQSTWSRTMADLLSRAQFSFLNSRSNPPSETWSVFAEAEKSVPFGERILPWEHLHHEGYWYRLSESYIQTRRNLAQQIPLEDRQSPGQSPASVIASKAHLYDTYLTLEPYDEFPTDDKPGHNYVEEICSSLEKAIESFVRYGQLRMRDHLELKKAKEYVKAKYWAEAILVLHPLWQSQIWREAGWWKILQQVGWALLDCAYQAHESELIIKVTWELSNNIFDRNPNLNYDLKRVLDHVSSDKTESPISIDTSSSVSRLTPAFAFIVPEGHVGEAVECQFSLQSDGQSECPPIDLSQVKIVFAGSFKTINLRHSPKHDKNAESTMVEIADLTLIDAPRESSKSDQNSSISSTASLLGYTDLTMQTKQIKVFQFKIIPREAGDVSVASVTLLLEDSKFNLTITESNFNDPPSKWWEMKSGNPICREIGKDRNISSTHILPKPPKMEIELSGMNKAYYTNEDINVSLDIINNEEEPTVSSIETRLISPIERGAQVKWNDPDAEDTTIMQNEDTVLTLPVRKVGSLSSTEKKRLSLLITNTFLAADHELEIILTYHFESDRETVLTRTLTVDVAVVRPFEANYDFSPRLDFDEWPNFFQSSVGDRLKASAAGLRQKYVMTANLCSFAAEPVFIEAILLTARKVTGGAICTASTGILKMEENLPSGHKQDTISIEIQPEQNRQFDFDLLVQKYILGDRHPVNLDLALEIAWHRQDSDKINNSTLEVPRFLISSAEPRVLLTSVRKSVPGSELHMNLLEFTIENPSMHFLTFNIAMESSEDFAFSGPKASAMSLVPLSRQSLMYRVLPNKRDEWIRVQLNVVDAYFGQTLRVQPAGEGVKSDKKSQILVSV